MPLSKILSASIAEGAVSSDYVLLATTDVTSSTASVSFDGYFSSTYKNYKFIISNAIPVTDAVSLRARFRRSNANVTEPNYKSGEVGFIFNSTPDIQPTVDGNYNTDYAKFTNAGISNSTSYGGISVDGTIFNPLNASSWKSSVSTSNFYASGNNYYYGWFNAFTLQDSTAALSGITFYFSSGNIASGNFKLYGIK